MPRESTTRTCLNLRSRQFQALQDLSRETGAPVAELARRAVDAFLVNRVLGYTPGYSSSTPVSSDPGQGRSTPRS
jgi:hypothetical protein